MESSVRGGWVSFAIWSSAVWWPARRSCLSFCWFGSWCCGTVCLMVAARRVHGSGGRSLWWSSVLSSHIAGCRCPGGREAHLWRCAGPSELFYAGLSIWERCSSRTRRWCSQLGCSPQCSCRTVWGFLSSDQISSVAWGKRDVGGPSSLLTVCSPGEVHGDVYTEELEAADPLHWSPVDGDGGVLSGPPPEIHHQLFGLTDVQREVVVVAPVRVCISSL